MHTTIKRTAIYIINHLNLINAQCTSVARGAVNRFETPTTKTYPFSPIAYDVSDITLIGGAALVAIDSTFTRFKQMRRGIFGDLRNEIQQETADMDLVWWPRRTNYAIPDEIYTANSPIILSFVSRFEEQLKFNLNRAFFESFARIPGLTMINVERSIQLNIGVHMISVYFQMQAGNTVKIMELAIHDTAASQTKDIMGHPIRALQDMTEDPVYSINAPGPYSTRTIEYNNNVTITIPNILHYINQQIFAYVNIRNDKAPSINKLNAIKRRIRYLMKVLAIYSQGHNTQNDALFYYVLGLNPEDVLPVIGLVTTQLTTYDVDLHEINDASTIEEYKNVRQLKEQSVQQLQQLRALSIPMMEETLATLGAMRNNNVKPKNNNMRTVDLLVKITDLVDKIRKMLQNASESNKYTNFYETYFPKLYALESIVAMIVDHLNSRKLNSSTRSGIEHIYDKLVDLHKEMTEEMGSSSHGGRIRNKSRSKSRDTTVKRRIKSRRRVHSSSQ